MKRADGFLIVTGVVSLAANVLAILSTLSENGLFHTWGWDRGLLAVLTFVLAAYTLTIWSTLTWRWTRRLAANTRGFSRRPAMFLIDSLVAFPLLTAWLEMLFLVVFFVATPPAERWLLALGIAWGATPFLSLGLMSIGEALGPFLVQK
jgi:hypothetical protein